jgi:hypothetical protein
MQRGVDLTEQTITIITWICVHVRVQSAEVKADDMAGLVAAPDASPPAAVLVAPRSEEVGDVT